MNSENIGFNMFLDLTLKKRLKIISQILLKILELF